MTAPEESYRIKVESSRKWPSLYDTCPNCGRIKSKKAKLCQECRVGPRLPDDVCHYCGPSCLFGVGICHCGCGERTHKSQGTSKKHGSIKGRPTKFFFNHHLRISRQKDELIMLEGEECVRVSLTQEMFAIIDFDDYERVKTIERWVAVKTPTNVYVRSNISDGSISLHRFIMNAKDSEMVDHKNGNGLDNRKKNLRLCNHSENMRNRFQIRKSSPFKGVYPRRGKWVALLCLGTYETAEEAAQVYDRALTYMFPEFGKPNLRRKEKCA